MSHLVTDRHSQVKAFMKRDRPDVIHWFDCWHIAKGIYKKLESSGKKKMCDKLLEWARSISNHIYWCAASSNGDGDLVHDKWVSILNHVTNVHEGHGGKYARCQHDQLDDRNWMKRGSKAYDELEKIVLGRSLVKDIKNISPAEQTSGLESFHRVVCHFAPKLTHFSMPEWKQDYTSLSFISMRMRTGNRQRKKMEHRSFRSLTQKVEKVKEWQEK